MNDPDSSGSEGDAQLIRRIRGGDRAAFLEFYDRYAPLLLSVAARVLGDRREAEDVLQDVFTQIWHKSSGYEAALGSLTGWAVTLTRNKAIDRVRASGRRRRLVEEVALSAETSEESGASANDLLYGPERAARVRVALAALPGEQRQVIELAFFAGLSQSEIASRLQQPLGTVKARIRRGMLKLREQLGGVL
ncbi:MAG: sigma-70 family RNA polymerase sigma factor [Steroidobacteraceae bacterium]